MHCVWHGACYVNSWMHFRSTEEGVCCASNARLGGRARLLHLRWQGPRYCRSPRQPRSSTQFRLPTLCFQSRRRRCRRRWRWPRRLRKRLSRRWTRRKLSSWSRRSRFWRWHVEFWSREELGGPLVLPHMGPIADVATINEDSAPSSAMVAGERLHSDTSTITKEVEVDSAGFRADNPDLFPRDEAQRRSDVVAAVSRQQDWLKRAPEREAERDTQRLVRRRIHQLETQDKVHEQLADLRNYQQFPEEGQPRFQARTPADQEAATLAAETRERAVAQADRRSAAVATVNTPAPATATPTPGVATAAIPSTLPTTPATAPSPVQLFNLILMLQGKK